MKTTVAQIASNKGTFCGGCDIEISRPLKLLASLFAFVPRSSSILLPFGNLQRLVLLLIRSPAIISSAGDNAWHIFNLTPAERRVADAVSAGLSIRESADRLGIAYETARIHLKSVFAKTGVHRQAALVALRNTISAAASASAARQPTAPDS